MGVIIAKQREERLEYVQALKRGEVFLKKCLPDYIKDPELAGLKSHEDGKSKWDDFELAGEPEEAVEEDEDNPVNQNDAEMLRRMRESMVKDHKMLFEGAARGSQAKVQLACRKNTVDKDACDKYGRTALYLAAERGHATVLNILLGMRSDYRMKTQQGWTPLHAATFHGNITCMDRLFAATADINSQDSFGCTPLTLAASSPKLYLLDLASKKDRKTLKKFRQQAFVTQQSAYESMPAGMSLKNVRPDELYKFFPNQVQLIIIDKILSHAERANVDHQDKKKRTPLIYAAWYGRTYVVSRLLAAKADHRKVDFDGRSALMMAASHEHVETAELLLRAGANVNVQDKKMMMPLHGALECGSEPMAKMLLDKKARPNEYDYEGRTPILLAMDKGSIRMFIELAQRGASLDVLDKRGRNVVMYAIEKDMLNMIAPILVKLGEKAHKILRARDPLGRNSMAHAVQLQSLQAANKAVQVLYQLDTECATYGDCNGDTSLHMAAELGRLEILRCLLKSDDAVGDYLNDHHETPLHYAALAGHLACFVALVTDRGKDRGPLCHSNAVDKLGRGVLHHACASGHLDLVNLILANRDGRMTGKPRDLVLYPVNVNLKDEQGATPLIVAAREGHWQLLPSLVLAGASLSAKDRDGFTALHWAACENEDLTVSCLLDLKVDPNTSDGRGWTPTMHAVTKGADQALRVLVDSGVVDLDARNWDGDTCLQLCLRSKEEPELVRITRDTLMDGLQGDVVKDTKIDAKGHFNISILDGCDFYMEGKVGELNTYVCLQLRTQRGAAPMVAYTSCVMFNPSPEWHETFRFDVDGLDSSAVLVAWVLHAPGDNEGEVLEGTELGLTEEELRDLSAQRLMAATAGTPAPPRSQPKFNNALTNAFDRMARKADKQADVEVMRMRTNALSRSRGVEPTQDLVPDKGGETLSLGARRWLEVTNLRTLLERNGVEVHEPLVPKSHLPVGCVVVRFRQLRSAVWGAEPVDVGRTLRLNCRGSLSFEIDFRPRFFEVKPDPLMTMAIDAGEDALYHLEPFDIMHESAEQLLGKLPEKPVTTKGRRSRSSRSSLSSARTSVRSSASEPPRGRGQDRGTGKRGAAAPKRAGSVG